MPPPTPPHPPAHTYTHTHTKQKHAHTHARTHMRTQACTHTNMHARTLCTHAHICMHASKHTHIPPRETIYDEKTEAKLSHLYNLLSHTITPSNAQHLH